MPYRWLAACGIGFLTAGAALAQNGPSAIAAPDCLDQPTYLPPLLKPPTNEPCPPLAVVPRGPVGEYDHNQFYLPEYVSSPGPEACRPLGRWWINASIEFAWLPVRPAPAAVRLRVPNGSGQTIPGPILPVGGVAPAQFQTGFGLNGGHWFDDGNTHGVDASFFFVNGGDRTIAGYAPSMLVLFPNGTNRSAAQVLVLPPGTPISGVFPTTLSSWYTTADVNYRHNLYCGPTARLDALAGYRFAFLQDELYLGESPDSSSDQHENNRIAVSNRFHGGQIGLAGEYYFTRWYLGGAAKVAFGAITPDVCATGLFQGAQGETARGDFARLAVADRSHQHPVCGTPVGKRHTRQASPRT